MGRSAKDRKVFRGFFAVFFRERCVAVCEVTQSGVGNKRKSKLCIVHVNKERFETYSTSGSWVRLQYVRGGGVRTGVEVSQYRARDSVLFCEKICVTLLRSISEQRRPRV